ncbi:hypothetical protein CDAR_302471 [Caerostris darwini]|uniref:Uncharacterized protein n=1 Tax=Caerostris darwini TaxID=1538125 RepID=A0AAV4NH38_9ARAC|nr:hypothetical protein CDAR_302471 [Caerostris darwini]
MKNFIVRRQTSWKYNPTPAYKVAGDISRETFFGTSVVKELAEIPYFSFLYLHLNSPSWLTNLPLGIPPYLKAGGLANSTSP